MRKALLRGTNLPKTPALLLLAQGPTRPHQDYLLKDYLMKYLKFHESILRYWYEEQMRRNEEMNPQPQHQRELGPQHQPGRTGPQPQPGLQHQTGLQYETGLQNHTQHGSDQPGHQE
jgi:hypothetical protein